MRPRGSPGFPPPVLGMGKGPCRERSSRGVWRGIKGSKMKDFQSTVESFCSCTRGRVTSERCCGPSRAAERPAFAEENQSTQRASPKLHSFVPQPAAGRFPAPTKETSIFAWLLLAGLLARRQASLPGTARPGPRSSRAAPGRRPRSRPPAPSGALPGFWWEALATAIDPRTRARVTHLLCLGLAAGLLPREPLSPELARKCCKIAPAHPCEGHREQPRAWGPPLSGCILDNICQDFQWHGWMAGFSLGPLAKTEPLYSGGLCHFSGIFDLPRGEGRNQLQGVGVWCIRAGFPWDHSSCLADGDPCKTPSASPYSWSRSCFLRWGGKPLLPKDRARGQRETQSDSELGPPALPMHCYRPTAGKDLWGQGTRT